MPDVNTKLLDQTIRHAVYLERYKSGTVKRMLAVLAKSESALRDELANRMLAIETRGFDTGPLTTQRIEQMIAAILQIRADQLAVFGESLQGELVDLAEYETPFLSAQIETTLPAPVLAQVAVVTPSPQQVYAAAMARPFNGTLLKEALTQLTAADAARIRESIRTGYATGQTTGQMISALMGKFGQLIGTRRNAEALIRTALQHTAMVARQEMLRENSDLIKGVKYVASLDSRTTPICRALDGKVWPADSSKIRYPPAHWQCRSTVTFITKSWKELGMVADEMPPGTRASMSGQVPDDLTYNNWLKTQSAGFQNDVLGKTRAQLFREGGLSMDRFVDLKTNHVFTLDDLRRRESDVWNKVFKKAS